MLIIGSTQQYPSTCWYSVCTPPPSVDDELKEVPIERLYATSALAYSTILLLALTIVVTLYNSYHTVLRWWCGPGTIYVLSFFAGMLIL